MTKHTDLRTDEQQREGAPYYPGVIDCGNCGAHHCVHVARGKALSDAASAFVCPRCGLRGEDLDGGHTTAVVPSGLPRELMEPVEDDGDTYMPGDDLLA